MVTVARIRRGGGSVHRHDTGGVARGMVDNSHRRVCIRLGIDSGVGDHDGYRHRRGHDHRTVIAFRTDIGVDAGGVAQFPGNLRVHLIRGDHHQRRRNAVEVNLRAAEFVGQRILVGIGRRRVVRKVAAGHRDDAAGSNRRRVSAAGQCGAAGRGSDLRRRRTGSRGNRHVDGSIIAGRTGDPARSEARRPLPGPAWRKRWYRRRRHWRH